VALTVEKKLQEIEAKYNELSARLSDPEAMSNRQRYEEWVREFRKLSRIMELYGEYKKIVARIEEDTAVIEEEEDEELMGIAREEIEELTVQRDQLEDEIKELLLDPDPEDHKDVIIEIRAGTGGDEASLFVTDLFRMYSRYADKMNWSLELMNSHPTEIGGFKEITFGISGSGDGLYSVLKYENGVHRVQRVPDTESSGRIHTSAASVVVLPEADEVEVDIDEQEIRIDVFRSSGPGGQSVNTTDSAVRITHIPTGLVVQCQDEKSQLKNKRKALKVLRARLLDKKQSEKQREVGALRRQIVGSGDRSEKIRTYNYPQGRVTDHRIKLTLYKLNDIMDGDMGTLLDSLRKADLAERLSSIHAEN
jgi:peptide chain release factor 1